MFMHMNTECIRICISIRIHPYIHMLYTCWYLLRCTCIYINILIHPYIQTSACMYVIWLHVSSAHTNMIFDDEYLPINPHTYAYIRIKKYVLILYDSLGRYASKLIWQFGHVCINTHMTVCARMYQYTYDSLGTYVSIHIWQFRHVCINTHMTV